MINKRNGRFELIHAKKFFSDMIGYGLLRYYEWCFLKT